MSQTGIALTAIIVLSVLFRDYLLGGAAALLLILHGLGAAPAMAALRSHSFDVGIFFLMVYLLLPLASDKLDLAELGKGLLSPLGIVALLAGLAVSYLGREGLDTLSGQPLMLFGVIVGTLAAVLFLRGLPAGLIIAAGLVAVLGKPLL